MTSIPASRPIFPIGKIVLALVASLVVLFLAYVIIINVRNGHAWSRHGRDATDAQNCLKERGSTMVLSEFSGGPLHLLCVTGEGTLYDIIVSKITRIPGTEFSEADLITAYKPSEAGVNQKLAEYAQHLITSKGAKIINLSFRAGEIFFAAGQ